MTDAHAWTATEALAHLAAGEISSREYLGALLDRIERFNAPLRLVVTLDAERALADARRADDERARGLQRGVLHGMPMTVKDSLSTAGLRTTSGDPHYLDHVPDNDAVAVARVRAAGAIVFGKTNLPTLAADVQSYNELFGIARNPWSPEHTTGGSSGGSAGALAAGFTPLEIGSDIAGSIRVPASCCGVVGHRPSPGIISGLGQIPGPPGTLTQADLAVLGPMARSPRDAALLLDVLSAPDPWDARAWSLELPPARGAASSRPYRVAAWLDDPYCPVSTEVLELLHQTVANLASTGLTIDHEARPERPLAYHDRVFRELLGSALAGQFSLGKLEERALHRREHPDDPMDETLGSDHAHLRHRQWLSANERRLQLRRQWRTFFESFDALLTPVMFNAPMAHDISEPPGVRIVRVDGRDRRYWEQITWAGLTGVGALPTTVVPAGRTRDGRPVGLAISADYLDDRTTLDIAGRIVGQDGVQLPNLA